MTTRGIRNNNPGNIERGSPPTPWQGLATPEEMTPQQAAEPRFAVFTAPKWGIRAMARTLISYQDKHGLFTIRGMISRWAPPGGSDGNHTQAYIDAVARAVGVSADETVDLQKYEVAEPMLKAMIRVENGSQPYPQTVIDEGLKLAGIVPPQKAAVRDAGVIGAVGTAAGGIAVAVPTIIEAAKTAQPVAESIGKTWPLVGIGLLLLAIGGAVWVAVKKRRTVEADR